MSSGVHLNDLYEKINSKFKRAKLTFPINNYPEIVVERNRLNSNYIDNILQSCTELYNQIDTLLETLRLTLPEIYEEQKRLIEAKVLGIPTEERKIVIFSDSRDSYSKGSVVIPNRLEMPLGINLVLDLLTESFEYLQSELRVNCDQCFYTAMISFMSLKPSLCRLLGRYNYVAMYPHRILIDRKILELGLRKHGMEQVLNFVLSAEEHFNNKKYVEFCAISRNALHLALSKTCLLLEGEEKGFANNRRKLIEIGFLRSTMAKQMKEFSGTLSSCGSHPPKEKLTNNEAKFLLDSLYSFLGLISLRLSTFRKRK